MKNEYPPENPPDKIGNEPAPLLLMAIAVVPLLGVGLQALQHDPKLLVLGPAPPPAGLDNP